MDGAVLSSLEDPAICSPRGVHVSETGQLLVCEDGAHSVVQVDGERGVVTLISVEDRLNFPENVYHSARTDRLIVVQANDSIMITNSK
ncbi:hypothetical protein DPMN_082437 [Dreissena polymorpha]|uniref:Uncharacterized protein n=2 Tax=Dreissena polymorpha TaxID=45954 RepID=A0A9D4BGU9_DREPO|nr:hypothetical protein DPMN_082437 [Dreissena polymorpha]